MCPGVTGKVFDIGQARLAAFSFSLCPLPHSPTQSSFPSPVWWEWTTKRTDSCWGSVSSFLQLD